MCEKNKKKCKTKLYILVLSLFIAGVSLLFISAEIPIAQAIDTWGTEAVGTVAPPLPAGSTPEYEACGIDGDVKAHEIGCRCNYDKLLVSTGTPQHITCSDRAVSNAGIILFCSTNNYNNSGVLVCLGGNDSVCSNENPSGTLDASCATGYLCKDGNCILDTGAPFFENSGLGTEVTDIRDTIRTFINIALGFLGVLCVVFIIYGGVLWLTSSGKSDQVKKGQDTMIWAALGAIIITIAWTITSYVLHIGEVVG